MLGLLYAITAVFLSLKRQSKLINHSTELSRRILLLIFVGLKLLNEKYSVRSYNKRTTVEQMTLKSNNQHLSL